MRQHHGRVLGLLARLSLAPELAALTAATLAAGKCGAHGSLQCRAFRFRVFRVQGFWGVRFLGLRVLTVFGFRIDVFRIFRACVFLGFSGFRVFRA